jgi:type IV fimbrial biogenesis protein FimT
MWGINMDVSIHAPHGEQEFRHGLIKTLPFQRLKGFTLIELLLTITLIAITLSIGVPGYQSLVASNRLTASINQLRGALALTRSEAVHRNRHVAICHSLDGVQCSRRGNWSNGWIIFVDKNRDKFIDESDEIIQLYHTINTSVSINYRAFGSRHYVVYRPSGFTLTNGTFTVCSPKNTTLKKALILTKSGRVRLSKVQDDGKELVCSDD